MQALRGIATLVVLLAALAGCSGGETFELVGTVERKNIELAAPVSEVIVDIPVQVGQRVEAGELIAQLDVEVAEAELRARQAVYQAAQATLTEEQKDFQRVEGLRRANVTATSELDRARRERDEAQAALAESAARLKQSEKRLADLSIRSRADGVVDQIPFDEGERVPAGGVVAVVLADENPWVRVWLPARAAARVRPGLEAAVRVQGLDGSFAGRIVDIAREPEFTPHYALTEEERAHLVFETRIELLDAPAELRPGVAAQVNLTVPDTAPSEDAS
ncbi:MAG TPA: efflux RND transporter periplasmic adaptor subunit [Acidobacteriota bacterium]|nr:efflux RND transporter periplasmic adaptor subunit [Acidobacteriota bacterium]